MNRDQYSEGHYVILQYQLSEVFCKRRFSLKFGAIHRKTSALESLFNKVAGLQSCTFIKRSSNTSVFLRILRIFKITYFEEHLRTADSDTLQSSKGYEFAHR